MQSIDNENITFNQSVSFYHYIHELSYAYAPMTPLMPLQMPNTP